MIEMESIDPVAGPSKPKAKPYSNRGNRNQPILSCLECRRMKWRCDRDFPCGHCRRRGLQDICPGNQSGRAKACRTTNAAGMSSGTSIPARNINSPSDLTWSSKFPFQLDSVSSLHPEDGAEAEAYDRLAIEEAQGGRSRMKLYRGAGWNFGLLSAASSLVSSPFSTYGIPGNAPPLEVLVQQLPDRSLGEHFARVYFEIGSVMNWTLDSTTFQNDYLDGVYSLIDRPEMIRPHCLAILYMVFAIGAQMDPAIEACNTLGQAYCSLAKSALDIDMTGSVEMIQAMQIMSRFLVNQGAGAEVYEHFWLMLGWALRSAQAIGLHRDGDRLGLDEKESELRRRVFWEIHTEDLIHSSSQGRPHAIHSSTIDAAFPDVKSAAQPTTFSAFYRHKHRLTRIWARINELQTGVEPIKYSEILSLDGKLKELQDGLPVELQKGAEGSTRDVLQGIAIRLLIAEGLLCLHRGHFARALRECPEEPLNSKCRYSYLSVLETSRLALTTASEVLEVASGIASRYSVFTFSIVSATLNLAIACIHAPASSIAWAVLDKAQEGSRLFETVMSDPKQANTSNLLRRYVHRAEVAMSTHRSRSHSSHPHEGHPSGLLATVDVTSKSSLERSEVPVAPVALPGEIQGDVDSNIPATILSVDDPPVPDLDLFQRLSNILANPSTSADLDGAADMSTIFDFDQLFTNFDDTSVTRWGSM
ncbi:hypothetical protein IAR55_001814 [Kwoniella newhampshirensis]|uniref:Zn(2)-C6 fungal-type domain-containing protein n=1 Tax=Kwoniella newhampshirensis TaxID=1651941 RepID=A0AAW0Z345_9TREE